jgi:hypothetical protein
MNTEAYILFLSLAYIITVHVGWMFYKNGRVFIVNLAKGDEHFADSINKLLLAGYYLLNLGFAALMISRWENVEDLAEMLSSVLHMLGLLVTGLGVMHYINMAAIYLYTKYNQHIHHKH